jgi:hypothetical protein
MPDAYELIAGEEYFGDDEVGDEYFGDDYVGDDEVGDEYFGDEYFGDEYVGDDEVGAALSDLIGDVEMGASRPRKRLPPGRPRPGALVRPRAPGRPVARAAPRPMARPVARPLARPAQPMPLMRPAPSPANDGRIIRLEGAVTGLAREVSELAKRMQSPTVTLPGGGKYRQTGPTKERQLTLGIDSGPTLIAAGSQQDVVLAPQVIFRGERLIIPALIADSFTIDDIRIGKDSQFGAAGSVPAAVYANVTVGANLNLDMARVGMQIVIVVTNVGPDPQRFRAGLIGAAIY